MNASLLDDTPGLMAQLGVEFAFLGENVKISGLRAKGSNVTIEIDAEAVPLMAEAANMYEKGVTTGSNANNRAKISDNTRFDYDLSKNSGEIFVDPQTSGGLLAALPESQAQEALGKMHDAGLDAARIIGHIRPPSEPDYLIFK